MLILASASERRAQILRSLGVKFTQCIPECSEETDRNYYHAAIKNALRKARTCAERFPMDIVLGYDTVVVVDGNMLGKPESSEMARAFLHQLSGCMHLVITGVAVVCIERKIEIASYSETKVYFKHLDETEIENYLASGEWRGKAGGYGIQGKAGVFVEKLEGCYFNVVGLPINLTYELLAKSGINLWEYMEKKNPKPLQACETV
ncbi:MAG: Maf family protein [Thermoplasmata archaeon]